MKIQFQLLKENENKPCWEITDVWQTIPDNCQPPNIGDCVSLRYQSPPNKVGHIGHFVVIARHFFYDTYDNQQPEIIAIVKETPNLPENNFRE